MNLNHQNHISSYAHLAWVLLTLLVLTICTVAVTQIDLMAWNVAVALLIASVKVFLVLIFFMHLKYERLLFKVLVAMVFLLFAVVVVITFFDYLFR